MESASIFLQAVASIQRYVISETATVFERRGREWAGFAVTEEDTLRMLEIGIDVLLAEFHELLTLPPLPETFR